MPKHNTKINYPGGLNVLANDLGDLSYDTLAEFLVNLSDKIAQDAMADEGRERLKLSKQLKFAAKHINNAWTICKPFMRSSKEIDSL